MENNVNTVNVSLSDYNLMKSNYDAAKELLTKSTEHIILLEKQQKENKVITLEKKVWDSNYGYKTVQELKLDIQDPKVSEKILEVISEVDTGQLSNTIEEKENEIKLLRTKLEDTRDVLDTTERSFKNSRRHDEDAHEKRIYELRKGYEDTILDLEIAQEKLQKDLANLKKDKTEQQLEVARQEELTELNAKLTALQDYQNEVRNLSFFGFKKFDKNWRIAKNWLADRPWANKIWSNVYSAVDRIQAFARVISEVGKLPEKKLECAPQNISYCNSICTRNW